MKPRKRLEKGKFNSMSVKCMPDGSQIITLSSDKGEGPQTFRVRDLYGPNEQEVDIDTGEPID